MAYIRPLTSPEGLYVYETNEGIEFAYHKLPYSKDSCELIQHDSSDFRYFMKKIFKKQGNFTKSISHNKISITSDVYIDLKTGKPSKRNRDYYENYNDFIELRHCLKIENKEIFMWESTWECFYHRYVEQNFIKRR
jgi:hypothetical protein